MKRKLRLLSLLMGMLAMVATNAFGHGTHYGKVTVNSSGNGTVYIGTTNNATSGNTTETWNCGGNGNGDSKTYILFAKPNDGYVFSNWQSNGTTYNENPLTQTFAASSTQSGNPTTFSFTANFEKISNYSNTFFNPILSVDAADPTVLLAEDGYYYMMCSESYSGEGMPLWRSPDMINWSKVTTIFAQRPANVTYDFLWAPELVYVNGKYLLFYANAAFGNQANTQICVATSDNPYGPFENNKILIRSKDSNFGALNANVNNIIDPSLFRDTDGKNYLIWGSFNGVYYVELDANCTNLASGASKKSLVSGTGGDWKNIEAPMMIKRDGYYYLVASKGLTVRSQASDDNPDRMTYQLLVARGTQLGGTFVKVDGRTNAFNGGNTMSNLLERNNYVLAPGHCSQIVTDKNGVDWIFYHGYPKNSDGTWNYPGSRMLFADKIRWGGWTEGWPGIMPYTNGTIEMPVIDEEKQIASSRQITTAADLVQLATDVNNGNPFINAVLMNDIDMSGIDWTPIGKDEEHKFQGIIDGQGHKIMNLRVSKNANDVALVGVANGGATFKNIIIDGTCSFTGQNQVAGFLGHARGTGSIQFLNCGNEATVTASGANASGFLGYTSGISIYWDNCYNTGTIKGDRESAAFSGWCGDRLRNCWNTGRTLGTDGDGNGKWLSLTRGTITMGYENTYDLNGANASVTGMPDGYNNEWLASGKLAMRLNTLAGNTIWFQTLDVDGHPVPLDTHGVIWVTKNCNGTPTDQYANEETTLIHNYVVTLNGSQLTKACSLCHDTKGTTVSLVDGYLQIGNADQLEMCMDYVTNGGGANAKMKLTADIDFTAKGNKMFGQDTDGKRFTGEFDGQYHKVTVAYNDGGQRTALFRILDGATVKNLTVDGTITMNTYNMAGGIFGTATNGANVSNCISAVTYIDAAQHDATFGGLGANTWTAVQIDNCAFVGKVMAPHATGNGGFVGYDNSGSMATFANSYIAADINWESGDDYVRNSNAGKRTNCYKLLPSDATLASGELCYNLNGEDLGENWYQTIGTDAYPIPFPISKKVYKKNELTYANPTENLILDEAATTEPEVQYAEDITVKRTMKAEKWNTFMIPFDMTKAEIAEQLGEGTKVKELTNVAFDGETYSMTFSETANGIEAGKPYMVLVPSAVTQFTANNKWISADIEPASINGLTYYGVYTSGYAPMESFIISDNKFYRVTSSVKLKAFRGYIAIDQSAGIKAVSFMFEDEDDVETAIDGINEEDAQADVIYNLSGQRVQKAQKGLYIVNGKKVLF